MVLRLHGFLCESNDKRKKEIGGNMRSGLTYNKDEEEENVCIVARTLVYPFIT